MARQPETKVQLATQEIAVREALAWRALKLQCEGSLKVFFREAWPQFDSSKFVNNWHLDAMAEHLMAVSHGQITRLLINIPPRFGKTNLVSIVWPVWTWAHPPETKYPLLGAGVRFLCASYGANKAEADGVTARRLIGGEWFKDRWGDRVQIAKDRDNQSQYDTIVGGSRISTGIPESLGKGGAIRVIDDPHKTDEVESDLVRAATVRAYDEVWRTRSNDPVYGAEVMVMQRLAEGDLSGHLLAEMDPALVHLMLPLEFDGRRTCHTITGFTDPRVNDGDLLWPDRFDRKWVANQKRRVGPHAWAGQYNQIPVARGGGIIQRDWWKVWPPAGQEDSWTRDFDVDGKTTRRLIYPDFEFILLACDTAYTEREENDYSACITWGVFRDEARNPKIMMIEAWRERLELRALVYKILASARRKGREADAVLVEAKASGLSVMQEMRRLMKDGEFTLFSDVPKGDKLARLHAASPAFSGGLVFAPERPWSELVIDEVASFPRSKFKDLTDCVSSGIKKLRDLGLLQHSEEAQEERDDDLMHSSELRMSPREEYGL